MWGHSFRVDAAEAAMKAFPLFSVFFVGLSCNYRGCEGKMHLFYIIELLFSWLFFLRPSCLKRVFFWVTCMYRSVNTSRSLSSKLLIVLLAYKRNQVFVILFMHNTDVGDFICFSCLIFFPWNQFNLKSRFQKR